jgi:cell division septation protein DedD
MNRSRIGSGLALAVFVIVVPALSGCAHQGPRGVPVESRPTPPQPGADSTGTTVTPTTQPTVMRGSLERAARMSRVVADTTAAGDAVRRCVGRKLLADEEGTRDATIQKIAETRAALIADDLPRAQSLAREARLLASALNCR